MNYREKFRKHYNINFSNEYDIHHIDLNHNNDDIDNLMILPKKLHHQYHFYINNFEKNTDNKSILNLNCKINGTFSPLYKETLNCYALANVIIECNKWYDYLLYLKHLIPNIHNIKLEE